MQAGNEFCKKITEIIVQEKIKNVIETGTYLGLGTTSAVLEGFLLSGAQPKDIKFVTIEASNDFRLEAIKNCEKKYYDYIHTKRFSVGTKFAGGVSVPKELLPTKLDFSDVPPGIYIDHDEKDRVFSYLNEVWSLNYDLLGEYAFEIVPRPEMIILDSAGHIGAIEFDYVMTKLNFYKHCYFCLDDTNHVKHYKTCEKMDADERFDFIWSTDEKFGSKIYKYKTLI